MDTFFLVKGHPLAKSVMLFFIMLWLHFIHLCQSISLTLVHPQDVVEYCVFLLATKNYKADTAKLNTPINLLDVQSQNSSERPTGFLFLDRNACFH